MSVSRETLAQRVSRALAEAGMTQADLSSAIGLNQSSLSRAMSGQRNFKSLELALIAQTLRVSTDELLAEEPDPAARLAARAQPDTTPSLDRALPRVEQFLDLNGLLVNLGFDPTCPVEPGVPSVSSPAEQGEVLAIAVRERLGADDLPYDLSELAGFLENRLGIDIAFEPVPGGLDGLSVSQGDFRLALVASDVSATRQRFTLAHELAHLLLGDAQDLLIDENVYGRKTPDERRANAFAAAFLMPADVIRADLPPGFVSEEAVSTLLGRFGVSLDSLAFRLHNLGIVNGTNRDRIRSMSSNRIALRSGRAADLQARNDRRVPGKLLQRTVEAYVAGGISIRPLAALIGVPAERLLDELSPPSRQPGPLDPDPENPEPRL